MKTILTAAALALPLAGGAMAETLTVYTYDSFVSEWGPGPQIEKKFEAVCDCDLNFVAAGDGAALIGRVKLEGEGPGLRGPDFSGTRTRPGCCHPRKRRIAGRPCSRSWPTVVRAGRAGPERAGGGMPGAIGR